MKSNNLKTKILATILLIVTLFAYTPISAIVYAAEVTATKNMSESKITLGDTQVEYTGKAITPKVTVKNGEATLEEDKDYTINYANNTNVGEATVTVTGKGSYTGTKTAKFEITKKDLSSVTPELANAKYTYNGNAHTPAVTVKDGETELKVNTDYTVNYKNNINAGTVTVTVTGKGNYKGTSKEVTFAIVAKSITGATVEGVADKAYDPAGATQNVVVKDGTKTLVKDTDYTVAYANNTTVGTNTASVTITGKGNYAGTITRDFSITKKDLKDCKVEDIETQLYDKTQKTPEVTVMNGKSTLAKNDDYTVEYKNNVEKGTATVTITGKGSYTGTKTATFKIVEKELKGATITNATEGKLKAEVYAGKEIIPNVVVYKDGKKLVNGTDYKLVCTNNKNVGTSATVTVVGIGDYAGSLDAVTFEITAKNINDCTVVAIPSQTLKEGSACKPAVTIKNGDVTLKENEDYTLSYGDNNKVGKGTVTVTVKSSNYTGTLKPIEFDIVSGKSIATCTIDKIADQKYTGKAIEAAVIVKNGATTLVKGTDYTVAYKNNVNVGTATVTITGINGYTGTKTATFKIVKEAHTHSYKTTKVTKATMSKNGTIEEKCSCGATRKTTIAKISSVKLSGTTYTYNGKTKYPQVTVKDAKGNKVASKYYTVKHSSSTRKNVGAYTVKVTFKGNYSGSKTLNFTIRPKAVKVSSVKAGSKRVTVKWNKQTAQTTGYQVQYATNNKFSKAKTAKITKNKTTSKTVTKLSAKKKYFVRVRTYKTVNGKTYYSAWSNVKIATTRK